MMKINEVEVGNGLDWLMVSYLIALSILTVFISVYRASKVINDK